MHLAFSTTGSPGLRGQSANTPPQIHGSCSASCLQAVSDLQPLVVRRSATPEDGEFCFGKKKTKAPRILHGPQLHRQEEEDEKQVGTEVLLTTSCKNQEHHEVTDRSDRIIVALLACAKTKDLCTGRRIHDDIVESGLLGKCVYVSNSLVNMYAKCGALAEAQGVFDELQARNVVSWTALIAGYAHHGHGKEAVERFEQMQLEGLLPNAVTFACILKACGSISNSDKGQKIHTEIVKQGLLEKSVVVGNALVDMYAKCGALSKSQEVFNTLPVRDAVSWNVLMAGYVQHGLGKEALGCFEWMHFEGHTPSEVTFACVLKACGSTGALDKGEELCAEIDRQGLLGKNVVIGSALVDMYAKCGALAKAHEVFNKLPVQDVVLWTALITGYAQHGLGKEAINCFEHLKRKGLSPNAVTFACILKACGSIGALHKGQELHAEIVKLGLLENNVVVGNALIDMYFKCGAIEKAEEVFDELPFHDAVSWNVLLAGYAQHGHVKQAITCFDQMPVRDAVSWNVLIASYAQQGQSEEAVNCFEQMYLEGLSPDVATFACTLKACGSMGAVEKGQQIHAKIVMEGFLRTDDVIGTALVDMYAKFGLLAKAQEVFNDLLVQDVVSWNVLIAGYAQLGKDGYAFSLFNKMIAEGKEPDVVTFTILLNICVHSGLIAKGQLFFEIISTGYGIIPILDHLNCMVDLYSRAGHINKAMTVIKEMPFSANPMVWHIVLGACQKWGNLKLGRLAFEHAVQTDEMDAAAYVCMRNMYAAENGHKVEE